MGRCSLIVLILISIFPGVILAQTVNAPLSDGWTEIKSYDGRFRVVAPGPFQEKVDTIETPIGRLAYHTFFYQAEEKGKDNLLYMLSYCDYPVHSIHSDSTELIADFFEATIDAAAFSIDGEVVYSDSISFFDYPGYIWRIDYLDGKAVIKTKAYLVERRYYALQTATFQELNLNTNSEKFLDSFRLLSD